MVIGLLISGLGIDGLKPEGSVLRLVEGDEGLGVLLTKVPFVGLLRRPGLDEDEAVGIVGASEEVVGDAAGFGPRCGLHLRGAGEDRVSRPRLELQGDDELVHPASPQRLIVAWSASMDDWMPASVDMVKSSISRLTQPL